MNPPTTALNSAYQSINPTSGGSHQRPESAPARFDPQTPKPATPALLPNPASLPRAPRTDPIPRPSDTSISDFTSALTGDESTLVGRSVGRRPGGVLRSGLAVSLPKTLSGRERRAPRHMDGVGIRVVRYCPVCAVVVQAQLPRDGTRWPGPPCPWCGAGSAGSARWAGEAEWLVR